MIPISEAYRHHSLQAAFVALCTFCLVQMAWAQNTWPTERPDNLDEPRPIDVSKEIWMEEMTWMEVRDAVQNGVHRVLVPTGGIEQNGPYLARSERVCRGR